MKKLSVMIKVEFEIPDSWELVKHPDNVQVIKIDDGCYMDMSYSTLLTSDFSEGAQWSSKCSPQFASRLLNMIVNESVSMVLEIK